MTQLSSGICLRLHLSNQNDDVLFNTPHTVQLISIKKVGPNAPERYRIIISDGEHFLQAMLATQLNNLINDGSITKHTVVTIERLTCNYVQGKRLFIILGLRVLDTPEEKIGNPVALPQDSVVESGSAGPSSTNPPPATSRPQQPQKQASSGNARHIFPIEGLSPFQNNWTIMARVTQKSDIRTWSNQRGEGKLFNVNFMDDSGEIKATAFNTQVDKFFDRLHEGRVYYVSKARVNLAKKKFSNLQNDYELSLDNNTEIEECLETANVPSVKYNFVLLSQLEELAKDSTCDVLGVVKEIGDLGEIITKANKPISKRELTLVDKSGIAVRLTLWGKQAEQYNGDDHPVIAFKGVKVGDFGGRSLSMISSSSMSLNPDNDEAFSLRGWYDSIGVEKNFQVPARANMSGSTGSGFNRSEIRHLKNVKDSQLGQSDKADFFSTRATVMHIRPDNISYPACPTDNCNKKVIQLSDGWRCEKCDKSFESPEHRYIVSAAVADWSGQAWFQGFNDAGLVIFGLPANDLVGIRERDENQYNVIMHKANCGTFNFLCRAKQDTYNDQTRVRYGISRIMPLEYREEACALRDLLHSPWAR